MKQKKIAVFLAENEKTLASVYPPSILSRLQQSFDLTEKVFTRAEVLASPEQLQNVSIIFSTWSMPRFSEEEIRTCFPKLEALYYAAGTVQSFARPFLACGVHVFSAWAANGIPVAEYTVAQIILANKGFFTHTALMRQEKTALAQALKGKYNGNFDQRIGLIGCGMIGSEVARRLKAYRLEVLVFDPFLSNERREELGVSVVSLPELFSSCAVISNHLANNEKTKGILNYDLFRLMPPYATFLNTGRGAQVVEADLVRILTERKDLTAILDVTYPEPPIPAHPFYTLPNCHLTPHIAGSLGKEVVRMAEFMTEEAERAEQGLPVRFEVTEAMLETMA